MSRRLNGLLLVCAFLLITGTQAAEPAIVTKVNDGDTIEVKLATGPDKIRLIGVDALELDEGLYPLAESARHFVKDLLKDASVILESDPECYDRGMRQRLLRYVYLPDGRLLNAELIAHGHALAYTEFPFTKLAEFKTLQREAWKSARGMWRPEDCALGRSEECNEPVVVVYVTHTGKKYHRQDCHYLDDSSSVMPLYVALLSYGACKVCRPPQGDASTSQR